MNSQQLQKLVPVAKLAGLSGAAGLTAYIASFSSFGVPAVEMAPPDLMAKQWSRMFHQGMNTAPRVAVACSACFSFLAYQLRGQRGRFPISPSSLFLSAAVLAPCIAPFTWAFMWTGVQKLEAKAKGSAIAPRDDEVKALVKAWSAQNYARSLIVGSSAILSAVAMLA